MSAGKERMDALVKLLLANFNKAMITGQVGLLLAVAYMWFSESSSVSVEAQPPKPVEATPAITRDGDAYKVANYVVKPLPPFEGVYYKELAKYNMFDPKMARDAEALAKDADKQIIEARKLHQEGKSKEALEILDRIISTNKYKPAQELRDEINKSMPAEATPAPATK